MTTTSTLCAGTHCLQRSPAATLLCRMRGTWPTWCTDVRTPPFSAHTWIEADAERIGEPTDPRTHQTLLTVPPTHPATPAHPSSNHEGA
ncbi:lasso peptide biosynthesis B2 protein [Streptomyces piniterrae]|uniref:lasso peptide biosynthesis B2 protein n=1 Tax=Streptomyces piniterrae TaxID=2571125 RepID=UPI001FECA346|nr:lasso peptide biosynthesis B2 protein [Streptomyces piniterrae]